MSKRTSEWLSTYVSILVYFRPQCTAPLLPFSVHVVGIDSTSRLNSIRHLPLTRSLILDQLDGIEFVGYNKVGLNTIPNWIPMFTGKDGIWDVTQALFWIDRPNTRFSFYKNLIYKNLSLDFSQNLRTN